MLEAELERHAAENERQQHQQNREVNRGDDDRERQRKSRHQADAAEHEPGLVAVPDRRDRIHHDAALARVRHQPVEDADTEIEAVEHHVVEHRQRQEGGP